MLPFYSSLCFLITSHYVRQICELFKRQHLNNPIVSKNETFIAICYPGPQIFNFSLTFLHHLSSCISYLLLEHSLVFNLLKFYEVLHYIYVEHKMYATPLYSHKKWNFPKMRLHLYVPARKWNHADGSHTIAHMYISVLTGQIIT